MAAGTEMQQGGRVALAEHVALDGERPAGTRRALSKHKCNWVT